ncbi:MAG: hypothetical protein AB2795_06360 [Candidatus Thiodiazotropha endolucinida]
MLQPNRECCKSFTNRSRYLIGYHLISPWPPDVLLPIQWAKHITGMVAPILLDAHDHFGRNSS